MTSHTQHPDDETLFDLIEGSLDESRAAEVEAHLDSCPACGEIVRAALVGSPDDVQPITPMPAEAVARMDAVLAEAWRERRDAITAREAAQDEAAAGAGAVAGTAGAQTAALGPDDAIAATPILPEHIAGEQDELGADAAGGAGRPKREPGRGTWGRRLVPILAFCVLAALAGISLQVGGHDATVSSESQSGGAASSDGGADALDQATQGLSKSQVPSSSAPEAAETMNGMDAGSARGAQPDAELPPVNLEDGYGDDLDEAPAGTDSSYDDEPYAGDASPDEICIATLDQTRLYLPDGRVPRTVLRGPLGMYLVCG